MFDCNLQGFIYDEYYNTYLTRRRVTGIHNMIKNWVNKYYNRVLTYIFSNLCEVADSY